MDPLNLVLKELETLYTQLVLKLTSPNAPDNPLSRKSMSQLSNKLYPLMNPSTQSKTGDQNKHIFLQIFQSHLTNYLNNNLLSSLIKCGNVEKFVSTVTEGWQSFKRFVFTYFALLIHAKDFYEKESINARQRENHPYPNVLPVPALALKIFNNLILSRYQTRFEQAAIYLLGKQRERQYPQDDSLRIILSIYWSCGLGELARMSMSKSGSISFWKEKNKIVVHHFKEANKNEDKFRFDILAFLENNSHHYYVTLYEEKLTHLNALEQVQQLELLCRREQKLAQFHTPSEESEQHYLQIVRLAILNDLQGILNKQQGLKYIFLNCDQHLQELMPHAILYLSLFNRLQDKSIPLVCSLVAEAITEKGKDIFTKQNKARQQIMALLGYMKAVRSIFSASSSHNLDIEQTIERQFKKILEPIQCSKNLAQFSDHTVRQCIRLKLDDNDCRTKFKDVLLLLASLAAKDSFLLHYQEHLSRRLIDSLAEPRTDIEQLCLQFIGEQLGNITIAHHLAMVKDIDKSIQNSEKLHDVLPFISYKWDLRVFSQSVWPQSTSRLKYQHIQSPSLLKTHTPMLKQLYQQYFGGKLMLRLDKGVSLFQGKFQVGKFRFQSENGYLIMLLHLMDKTKGASLADLRELFMPKKGETKTVAMENLLSVLIECKLVIRTNKEGSFCSEQIFNLNCNYKPPPAVKPNIPIQIRPSPTLLKQFRQVNLDQAKILKERQKLIDAMLVKTLKHAHATKSNSISFMELYQSIKSNSFLKDLNIPQSLVKQRLQHLISKQFCIRDEEDRKIYHYIA